MKRTATTFVLLAGLGGGCATQEAGLGGFNKATPATEIPGVVGATGEPVQPAVVAAGQMPTDKPGKVVTADVNGRTPAGAVRQSSGLLGRRSAYVGGVAGGCDTGNCGDGGGAIMGGPPGLSPYGPTYSHLGTIHGRNGILPPTGMGPPGAVAAVGAIGPMGGGYGPMYPNQRTSVKFVNPAGMKVTWQGPGGMFVEPAPFEAPAVYNFAQSGIYRLKLSGIPNRPGKFYYPTLEVYAATPKTVTYLSHSSVPLAFTDEDLEQVNAGNLVVKVIYLPDAAFQDLAVVAGADEVVSTRLEPGADPIAEANRRGTILAVVRIGNIDLENPNTPAMGAPPGMIGGPPPGAMPAAPPAMPSAMPSMPTAPQTARPLPVPPSVPVSKPAAPGGTRPISLPALPGTK
jgi:hypothetical protein